MLLKYRSCTEIHGDWAVEAAGLLAASRFLPPSMGGWLALWWEKSHEGGCVLSFQH
jgi:hypothetical protein